MNTTKNSLPDIFSNKPTESIKSPSMSSVSNKPLSFSLNNSNNSNNSNNLDDLNNIPVTTIKRRSTLTPENVLSNTNKSLGIFSNFFNPKTLIIIILSILLLSIIGFNVFNYLAKGTDATSLFLQSLFNNSSNILTKTTKSTVGSTLDGTSKLIDGTSDSLIDAVKTTKKISKKGISQLENTLTKNKKIINPENNDKLINKNMLNKKIVEPEPIDTSNETGGYCYIGKVNDTRKCAKVSDKSYCMSGDIYPSEDSCINSNLRN